MMSNSTKREKVDYSPHPSNPPKGWTRCHVYIPKKNRFCRQAVVGERYCGNHQHFNSKQENEESSASAARTRTRIACPMDPSHTIYEDSMKKHILICPKVTRQKNQESQWFYSREINSGGQGGLSFPSTASCGLTPDDGTGWAEYLALRVLRAYCTIFMTGSDEKNSSRLFTDEYLRSLSCEELYRAIPTKDCSQAELNSGLAESVQHYHIRSGGPRHLQQQASIVGHLRQMGMLKQTHQHDTSVLEMGAGRGMLGLVVAGAVAAEVESDDSPNVHLTMVERAGTRSKADTRLRNALPKNDSSQSKNSLGADEGFCGECANSLTKSQSTQYLRLEKVEMSRIKCDLAHIDMEAVLTKTSYKIKARGRKQRVLVVAKHLCGAGTDLALKSLEKISKNVDACALASCCHGVCNWEDYVGRSYLAAVLGGCSKQQFKLMAKWSSGTVLLTNEHDPDTLNSTEDEHVTSASPLPRDDGIDELQSRDLMISSIVKRARLSCGPQGFRRACQRLINYGRQEFMKASLFPTTTQSAEKSNVKVAQVDVEMFHYVSNEVTPQNLLLLGKRAAYD